MVMGTLVGRQDDHETVCGFSYRDAVYRFTLAEPSDVNVTVDGEAIHDAGFGAFVVRRSGDALSVRSRGPRLSPGSVTCLRGTTSFSSKRSVVPRTR